MATVNEAQWATLDRRAGSTATLVATRTFMHKGVQITAGVTRLAEDHPFLTEIRSAFDSIDSDSGKQAIRSRGGEAPKPKRRKRSWEI